MFQRPSAASMSSILVEIDGKQIGGLADRLREARGPRRR
jgi:hypothetical protein